ncbi:glycoprotein-N-acetylgalactosamine 3-beta-galactosyltransferase 1-like [Neocloeon triangulifer]|uniref:glycoprotein-N-acetylgalactosamine 3-beta-galactosyltransferase 1-like n=1 Tax=Neocloeon triangulifer TaxID=2078957 RepID=UPI00286F951B|nr:glycoprotein-N-acetylgalactosamine 3-beta-galactosyltransferase 1-like [Neocloeon triangulifer]
MVVQRDMCSYFLIGFTIGAIFSIFTTEKSRNSQSEENYVLSHAQKVVSYLQEIKDLPKTFRKRLWRTHQEHLASRIRVLCFVMTHPNNHNSKAQYIRYSWGRHCNRLVFISDGTRRDDSLPVVKVNAKSGRSGLWDKVKKAFRYMHSNYSGQYDWIIKADDDTFVNVDSLRNFLLGFSPEAPLFFGEQLRSPYDQIYMAGGGGYVLSRVGVQKFIDLLNDPRSDEEVGCSRVKPTSEEDPFISHCLIHANVSAIDSRDHLGQNRFSQHSGIIRSSVWGETDNFYWRYQLYKSTAQKPGPYVGCCSSSAISFHYTRPLNMFFYDFLIRKVNPEDTSLTLALNPRKYA